LNKSLDQAARLIEAERAMVANEIHDGVLPLLFGASASLASLLENSGDELTQPVRERIEQTKGWIDDAMQRGRQILTETYPPELERTAWSVAAIDTVGRLLGESAVRVKWQLDDNLHQLPYAVAGAAYRIVVEAVRNAIRHGNASEVVVAGAWQRDRFCITVRDNGKGFDPANIPEGHFGVRSMRGRAELVGGDLTIDSKTGGPTEVRFEKRVARDEKRETTSERRDGPY
jgi:signal transduction histidine kinase